METKQQDQTWIGRFLRALPAAAAPVWTFLFFTPLETVMLNAASFRFTAAGEMLFMAAVSLGATAVLSALVSLLRGKAYRWGVTGCAALGLSLYVQGTFLNGATPPLNDNYVAWDALTGAMIVNGLIWIVLLAVPFLLLAFFPKIGKGAAAVIPLLVLVMQAAGFASTALRPESYREYGYASYADYTDYSSEGNVLVFMLDRLDYEYIRTVEEEEPGFFDGLDGFIRYDNAVAQYSHTRNGMNFILTNYDRTLFQEKADDFFYHSWDDGERHLLRDLKEGGWTADLYGMVPSLLGKDYEHFLPLVNNLRVGTENIDRFRMLTRMMKLSAYRTLPLALKGTVWMPVSLYSQVFNAEVNYETDQSIYDERMEKMTVGGGKKYFKFYEFSGSHDPHTLDRDGKKAGQRTDEITQTMGSFAILKRAFQRMKDAGIYRDAAILIVADHAAMLDDYIPLPRPARIGLFYKPAGAEGTPLTTSFLPVSQRNLPATMLKSAGLPYAAYGVPLDEVEDDPETVRDYCRTLAEEGGPYRDSLALYYEVAYDASLPESWTLQKTERIDYPLGF